MVAAMIVAAVAFGATVAAWMMNVGLRMNSASQARRETQADWEASPGKQRAGLAVMTAGRATNVLLVAVMIAAQGLATTARWVGLLREEVEVEVEEVHVAVPAVEIWPGRLGSRVALAARSVGGLLAHRRCCRARRSRQLYWSRLDKSGLCGLSAR